MLPERQMLFLFMNLAKIRVLGSSYVGLFGITNDKLCLVPNGIDDKILKTIETTLDVKALKTSIYESSLLAVFAKMNDKQVFLPSYATPKEIDHIEKEAKVCIIQTEHALGNMVELNDYGAIASNTLPSKEVAALKAAGLRVEQTNLAKTDAVGSTLVATNKSFLVSPNASREEIKRIEDALNVKGGSSTANTGDALVRNSVMANSKGAIVGDMTTGFELNRIEEALEQR